MCDVDIRTVSALCPEIESGGFAFHPQYLKRVFVQGETQTSCRETQGQVVEELPRQSYRTLPQKTVGFTVGQQSDAVVLVQSGPVGKAIHTACTHDNTELCIQAGYQVCQQLTQLYVDGSYLGTPPTPGSLCPAARAPAGF